MKLRGIEFGPVLGAAGTQGFFGEGYWFHPFFRLIGLRFGGMTFTAKTTTMERRLAPERGLGNMALTNRFTPKEFLPQCIWVNVGGAYALNSVGLSGPEAQVLLETKKWQKRREPFFLSFMPIGKTRANRLNETNRFVLILKSTLPHFQARVGLQFNVSCPNTGHNLDELFLELTDHLESLGQLGIPIMVKLNLLVPPERAVEISEHPVCDAICMGNALPFGQFLDQTEWKRLFPPHGLSPLEKRSAKFGGGGFSGAPLFEHVYMWVERARRQGLTKPINVCGGIMHANNVSRLDQILRRGYDSISIGTVIMVRPWRVASIIREAHHVLG